MADINTTPLNSVHIATAGGAVITDTFKTISATTYTIIAGDNGKVLRFTAATDVTVTLPDGIAAGFNCLWHQVGAGKVSFVLAVTSPVQALSNFDGYTKSAGQKARGSLSRDLDDKVWLLDGYCGV